MGLFALGTFVAVCLVSSVSSCSCVRNGPQYLQDIYCKASFVIQVKVVDYEEIKSHWKYKLNDTVVLKSSPEYNDVVDKNHLYTSSEISGCGVWLNVGTTYIISGYVRDGRLWVHLCGLLHTPLSKFTEAQLCYLRSESGYAEGCKDCTIHYCKNKEECDEIAWDGTSCIGNQDGLGFTTRNENTVCALVTKKFYWIYFKYCDWSIPSEPLSSKVCKAKGR